MAPTASGRSCFHSALGAYSTVLPPLAMLLLHEVIKSIPDNYSVDAKFASIEIMESMKLLTSQTTMAKPYHDSFASPLVPLILYSLPSAATDFQVLDRWEICNPYTDRTRLITSSQGLSAHWACFHSDFGLYFDDSAGFCWSCWFSFFFCDQIVWEKAVPTGANWKNCPLWMVLHTAPIKTGSCLKLLPFW